VAVAFTIAEIDGHRQPGLVIEAVLAAAGPKLARGGR
jgi:hypothetical protein